MSPAGRIFFFSFSFGFCFFLGFFFSFWFSFWFFQKTFLLVFSFLRVKDGFLFLSLGRKGKGVGEDSYSIEEV